MMGTVSSAEPSRAPPGAEAGLRGSSAAPRVVAAERLFETLSELERQSEREADTRRPASRELRELLAETLERLEAYHELLIGEVAARTRARGRYGALLCDHLRRAGNHQKARVRRLEQRAHTPSPRCDVAQAAWAEARVLLAETRALGDDAALVLSGSAHL